MQEEVTQRTIAPLCGGHQTLRRDAAAGHEKKCWTRCRKE